jgi:hypothetical protein
MTAGDSPMGIAVVDSVSGTNGVNWLAMSDLNVRQMTQSLLDKGARFITITTYELPGNEGSCLEYVWDLEGQLFGFSLHVTDRAVPSIFDLCEAADWIEREVHEEYAIDFTGRTYEPLLLRDGDKPGVNLREVAQ